jgi:hypothetical protein
MRFLTLNRNSVSDGMCSQVMRRLRIWGYCLLHKEKFRYVHSKITKVAHGVSADKVETFFNLGYNEISIENCKSKDLEYRSGRYGDNVECSRYFKLNPEKYNLIRDELLAKMSITDKPKLEFDSKKNKIAVHIRRGDICNNDELFSKKACSDEYYIKAIENVLQRETKKESDIYIFSENVYNNNALTGIDIFKKIKNTKKFKSKIFIDTCPFHSLWHMINSDYLVTSHGAYSEFASILCRGKVLVPDKSVNSQYNRSLYNSEYIKVVDDVSLDGLNYFYEES